MTFKSETQGLLKSFIAFVKTQFQCSVQQVRADNGSEFISMRPLFNNLGILFQHSCPTTPQQKGVVERKHHHLLNVARALRFQAHLPLTFWGESILTAAYIINRLPTPVLSKSTPYEKLHNTIPHYNHMRVFGCLCYATSTKPSHKFDSRARRCIFVGYPLGQKAYRLYDLFTKTFFSSRDVTFHETIFPFTTQPQDTQTDYPDPSVLPLPLPDVTYQPTLTNPSNMLHAPTDPTPIPQSPNITTLSHTQPNQFLDNLQPNLTITSSPNNTMPSPPFMQLPPPEPIHPTIDTLMPSPVTTPPVVPRRSQHERHPPPHLQDYHYSNAIMLPPGLSSSRRGTHHPLSNFVSYDHLSPSHRCFITSLFAHSEPKSFAQAYLDPRWKEAMHAKLTALEQNKTWTLCPLPQGKRAIGSKWVYKIKYRSYDTIERYKARLVAKGYTQMEGFNYTETFSPVDKLVTLK
ncbi:unnamed protein product [Prunus armeniaca]